MVQKRGLTREAEDLALQPWGDPTAGVWGYPQSAGLRVFQRLSEKSAGAAESISDLLLIPPGGLTPPQAALLRLLGVWGDLLGVLQREGERSVKEHLQVYQQHGWAGLLEKLLYPLIRSSPPWAHATVYVSAVAEAVVFAHHRWKLRECRYQHLFVAPGRGAPPEVCPAHQPLALRERVRKHRERVSTQRKVGNTLSTHRAQKGASRRKVVKKRVGRNPRQK